MLRWFVICCAVCYGVVGLCADVCVWCVCVCVCVCVCTVCSELYFKAGVVDKKGAAYGTFYEGVNETG